MSFDIESGIRLGIAGLKADEKIAFVHLLTGAAAPSDGRILLDGVDLRGYDRAYLGDQFATVLKEDVLFAGTVGDNIAGSHRGASRADVMAAARAVNAHELIVRLPGGYDAPVAEPGVSLSNRERLHILLARAFLKDAPILLLDEPWRARNDAAEAALVEGLERLMAGRTVIMLVPHPSQRVSCDAWVRVRRGRWIEPRGPSAGRDPLPARVTAATLRAHQLEHPAVKAWARLRSVRIESARVDVLYERQNRAVYRLPSIGPGHSSVVAKWRRREIALPEHAVYSEVLSRLPVGAPRYYGRVDEQDGFCWLFCEDVGEDGYSPLLAEHRSLAGQWLGSLHTSAQRVGVETAPSQRLYHEPDRYFRRLQSAHAMIRSNLPNSSLQPADLAVLRTILSHLETGISYWSDVARLVAAMPRTLVHGDFHENNLRVRIEPTGLRLAAFDWEHAGWGVPAADFAFMQVDALAYWSTARPHWPGLEVRTVLEWASIGRIFRCIDDLRDDAPRLATDRLAGAMLRLRRWESELATAIRAMNWGDGTRTS